jgi:hypothetical protein
MLAAILLVFALSTAAHAQSTFVAQGLVGELGRKGETITFRLIGLARLKYWNALPEDRTVRREKMKMDLRSIDIVVRIPFSEKMYASLRELLDDETTHAILIVVDDPSLTFSNEGELTRVSGTGLNAQPAQDQYVP